MIGVPIIESTKILCDNESNVKSSTNIDSTLNKKHCVLSYHAARWTVTAGIVQIGWVPTDENIADTMTKRLSVEKKDKLFGTWTHSVIANWST